MDQDDLLSTTEADVVVNGQQKEEGERNVSSATTVEDDTEMPNSG